MKSLIISCILLLVSPSLAQVFNCNFEGESAAALCGLSNSASGDVDWAIHSGSTPSANTGPRNDHTLNDENGHYMFMEASGVAPGLRAVLSTPQLALDGSKDYCVSFWYHMLGEDVGSLTVGAFLEVTYNTLWSENDAGVDIWQYKELRIAGSTQKLEFIGTKGGNDAGEPFGDIAIDDILIQEGQCGAIVTPSTTTVSTSTSRTTTSSPTTTTSSSTTTTSPRTTTRPTTRPTTTTTRPTTSSRSSTNIVSSTSMPSSSRLTTSSVRQSSLSSVSSSTSLPVSSVTPSPRPSTVLECDFENGMVDSVMMPCDLTQLTTDDFDWKLNSGPTDNANTGPQTDHTYKNSTGKYAYIDASGIVGGATASLKSVDLNLSNGGCLKFWYHMFGNHVGYLSVTVNSEYTSEKVWSKSGSQGREWHEIEISLNKDTKSISITAAKGGNDEKDSDGNTAIDDIMILRSACSNGYSTSTIAPPSTDAPGSKKEEILWGLEGNIWIIILVCAAALVLILLVIIFIQACALHNLRKAKFNMPNDYSEIGYSTTHSRKSQQDYITAYEGVDAESKRNSNNSAVHGATNVGFDGPQSTGSYGSNPQIHGAEANGSSFIPQY